MIEKSKILIPVSFGALAMSILSVFFSIIFYMAGSGPDKGTRYGFNLIRLLDGRSYVELVQKEYRGGSLWGLNVDKGTSNILLGLLCLIGILAIVLSIAGLISMTKQYESAWPFRLTLAGIICTAIPAIAIFAAVCMSGDWFYGTMQVGAYVYITPPAMLVSWAAVVKRHRLTQEEIRVQKAAGKYIRPAGDLPLQQRGGEDE